MEIFAAAAEVGFTRLVLRLGFGVGDDAAEELKCAFHFRVIEWSLLAEELIVETDDRLTDFLVRVFVTRHDGCLDSCKQDAFSGWTMEGSAYVARGSVHNAAAIAQTKKMIHRAFERQQQKRGLGLVEILTMCPTGWFVPTNSGPEYMLESLGKVYPFGELKDVGAGN